MKKYGADQWSFPETKDGDIDIYFSYKGQPVSISLHSEQMFKRMMNLKPRADRDKTMEAAKRVIARQAFNYLKVTFEVIETGLFSPVEALLPHFLNEKGQKFSDVMMNQNPDIKKLLPPK